MIRLIARPRGLFIDLAIRIGEHPDHLRLAGNATISPADWKELRGVLERGAHVSSNVEIHEPRDQE